MIPVSFTPEATGVEYFLPVYEGNLNLGTSMSLELVEVPMSRSGSIKTGKLNLQKPKQVDLKFALYTSKANLDTKLSEVAAAFIGIGKLKLRTTDNKYVWRLFSPEEIEPEDESRGHGIYKVTVKGYVFPNYYLDSLKTGTYTVNSFVLTNTGNELTTKFKLTVKNIRADHASISTLKIDNGSSCSIKWDNTSFPLLENESLVFDCFTHNTYRSTVPTSSILGYLTLLTNQTELFFLRAGANTITHDRGNGNIQIDVEWYDCYRI